MNPPWTWAVTSTPCLAQWCWHIPWVLAYSWPLSGHATWLPNTQAFVCSVYILLVASTFPHLLHGDFSPWCIPMWTIKRWWVLKDFWHTGQSFLSHATAGIWDGISATSLAWTPSGKSSPLRRANTSCWTHFKALFFTTTSSSARRGSSGTGVGAGPPNWRLATLGMARQDPQPCLHLTTQQPHHLRCQCDGLPSTWTPWELNTPAPTSITLYWPRLKRQQANHSLNRSYITGRKCHSFIHSFGHSPEATNTMQDVVIHSVCHSFIDIRQKLSLVH